MGSRQCMRARDAGAGSMARACCGRIEVRGKSRRGEDSSLNLPVAPGMRPQVMLLVPEGPAIQHDASRVVPRAPLLAGHGIYGPLRPPFGAGQEQGGPPRLLRHAYPYVGNSLQTHRTSRRGRKLPAGACAHGHMRHLAGAPVLVVVGHYDWLLRTPWWHRRRGAHGSGRRPRRSRRRNRRGRGRRHGKVHVLRISSRRTDGHDAQRKVLHAQELRARRALHREDAVTAAAGTHADLQTVTRACLRPATYTQRQAHACMLATNIRTSSQRSTLMPYSCMIRRASLACSVPSGAAHCSTDSIAGSRRRMRARML